MIRKHINIYFFSPIIIVNYIKLRFHCRRLHEATNNQNTYGKTLQTGFVKVLLLLERCYLKLKTANHSSYVIK